VLTATKLRLPLGHAPFDFFLREHVLGVGVCLSDALLDQLDKAEALDGIIDGRIVRQRLYGLDHLLFCDGRLVLRDHRALFLRVQSTLPDVRTVAAGRQHSVAQ
jgi:hypothetical protein